MTQTIELQVNDDLPLRDVVFQTLRQAILSGKLQPGERLMELHLAKQLGVSRTPVREALRKLELEGLVTTIPRRGAIVAEITRSDLEDVLEVREALEELALKKVCERMSSEDLQKLEKAAVRFRVCLERGDVSGGVAADVEFHEIIAGAAGNLRLTALLGSLRGQFTRYRLENLKNQSSHQGLILQHELICEAIRKKDPEKACEALRMHIENQRQAIIENLQKKS